MAGGCQLHYPSEAVRQHTANQFALDDEEEIIALGWQAALALIADQQESYAS